ALNSHFVICTNSNPCSTRKRSLAALHAIDSRVVSAECARYASRLTESLDRQCTAAALAKQALAPADTEILRATLHRLKKPCALPVCGRACFDRLLPSGKSGERASAGSQGASDRGSGAAHGRGTNRRRRARNLSGAPRCGCIGPEPTCDRPESCA